MSRIPLNNEVPKDLGIVIKTEKEIFWDDVIERAIIKIKEAENEVMLTKEILKIAKHRTLLEKKENERKN